MKLVIVYTNGSRYIASEVVPESVLVTKDIIAYSYLVVKSVNKVAHGIYTPVQHISIDPEKAGVAYVIIVRQEGDIIFFGIKGKRGITFEVVPVRSDITLDVLQDGIDINISPMLPRASLPQLV